MTISDEELFRGIEHLRCARGCLSGEDPHPEDFWRVNADYTCWLNTNGEELLTTILELKNENGKLEKSLDLMFVMQEKFKAMRKKYYDVKDRARALLNELGPPMLRERDLADISHETKALEELLGG